MEFNSKKHLYFQYNFRANGIRWLSIIFFLLILSAGGIIMGFLLRGMFSFLNLDTASSIFQFIDLLITGGLVGVAVSLLGGVVRMVIIVVNSIRLARKIMESDEFSVYEHEETYQVEYKRIDEQDSTHH